MNGLKDPSPDGPKFKRRASMTADTPTPLPHNTQHTNSLSNANSSPSGKDNSMEEMWRSSGFVHSRVTARLCGSSRSKCGYCGGSRLHVLEVDDGWNKVIPTFHNASGIEKSLDLNALTNHRKNNEANMGTMSNDTGVERVNGDCSSKSYGLLFDYLPYDIYQEFIDRGWRRSGKHLYHPHNSESCCPALSIRLDVTKFSSATSHQSKGNEKLKSHQSEMAKRILTGGSCSQRRVGKRVLKALELHNSNCNGYRSKESQRDQSKKCSTNDYLHSSCSTHTSHVNKMQLNDIDNEKLGENLIDVREKPNFSDHETCVATKESGEVVIDVKSLQTGHIQKRSRQLSPLRDLKNMGENLSQRIQSSSIDPSTIMTSTIKFDKLLLKSIEEDELIFLEILAKLTYQAITKEVVRILTEKEDSGLGENESHHQLPHWVWWDNNHTENTVNVPKWCSFKAVQPKKARSKRIMPDSPSDVSLVLSTSACASAAGLSRGVIDKTCLAPKVVDSVKMYLTNKKNHMPSFHVQNVTFDEKSGHVFVMSTVPSNYLASFTDITPEKEHDQEVEEDPFTAFFLKWQKSSYLYHQTPSSVLCIDDQRHDQCVSSETEFRNQQLFLSVRSVPVYESSLQPEVHQLFCHYQSSVHGDFNPFEDTSLDNNVNNDADDGTDDYMRYQRQNRIGFLDVDATYSSLNEVKRSKIKKSYLAFYRFLCETPLVHETLSEAMESFNRNDFNLNLEDGYDVNLNLGGTYHQQYRLSTSPYAFDGPLIAVGVVDILPDCLSSVYAFYDPCLSSKLELGKYTALREIEWVRRAKLLKSRHYYLGYYIHSCQKMKYKAEYKPSEILCPTTYKWVDFECAKEKLEKDSPIRHCCTLYETPSDNETMKDEVKQKFRVEDIILDIGGANSDKNYIRVGMLNSQGRRLIDPVINEFSDEVGLDLCHNFVVKIA